MMEQTATTEMCEVCEIRPRTNKHTCGVCLDLVAEAFADGIKNIMDRVRNTDHRYCKNCEDLKEKGRCPAICPGSKKDLEQGVKLMKESQKK